MQLSGSRVLVTGASRGLGAAVATRVAERGARVALVARSHDAIAKLAAELAGDAYPADLADPEGIEPLVARVTADGPIDVLVNNAGVDLTGALTELPAERIRELILVNLLAPMLLCRAVIPGMQERGRGHIVNVSSLAGTNALPGVAPYSTSKAGLSHFTASLRAELKGTPITTTLVEIGPVESSMMESLRGHEPTRRALERLAKLQLVADLDMDGVADALVGAIERERRHLRLPRRDALFPLLTEAPRRMTEWLLTGVDAR
ncbi:MAG TPA: SDR family NAD(P)-dependent oxidoreductase [Acidimicrobiia bacterium]